MPNQPQKTPAQGLGEGYGRLARGKAIVMHWESARLARRTEAQEKASCEGSWGETGKRPGG